MSSAAILAGDPPWRAANSTVIPIGYALLVTIVGRRSETVSVLAGRPVDERCEHINLEASAWALGVTAIVILGAFWPTLRTATRCPSPSWVLSWPRRTPARSR